MKKIGIVIIGVTLLLLCSVSRLSAQSEYFYTNEAEAFFITGTSTLHDWQMDVDELESTAVMNLQHDAIEIVSVELTLPVKNLHSETSAMDKKAYQALKSSKFSTIKFATRQPAQVVLIDDFSGNITGEIEIAGVVKTVMIPFRFVKKSEDSVVVSGTVELKMSDFNVEAPSFMFGSITTGDAITLHFNMNYKKK